MMEPGNHNRPHTGIIGENVPNNCGPNEEEQPRSQSKKKKTRKKIENKEKKRKNFRRGSASSLIMGRRPEIEQRTGSDISAVEESDVESVCTDGDIRLKDEEWGAPPQVQNHPLYIPRNPPNSQTTASIFSPSDKSVGGCTTTTSDWSSSDAVSHKQVSTASPEQFTDDLPADQQLTTNSSSAIDNDATEDNSKSRMFKITAVVSLTIVVGIMIGIALAAAVHFLLFGEHEDEERGAAGTVPFLPTLSPSLPPTFISTDILLTAIEVSGVDVLADSQSSQFKAVAWMSSTDEIDAGGLDNEAFSQRYALVVMYFSFQGEDWFNQEQWLTPHLHECDWSNGIFCESSAATLLVTGFDATRNNLQGTIPHEIGLLSSFEYFRIPKNKVRGMIPNSIGRLTALSALDMSNNALTGPIPATIQNAQDLIVVDLSKNQLSSSIPIELYSLQYLRTLQLQNNKISGPLVETISNLTSLVTLDFRNNQLTGTFPLELDVIESLDIVRVDHNRLGGKLRPVTKAFMLMHTIGLSHNFFSGNVELHPSFLTSNYDIADLRLQHVDVSYNLLSGPISPLFGFLPTFRYFDVSGNGFVGTFPSSVGWDNIEVLAAANNGLTGTVPVGYPSLTHLDFGDNFLSEGIPEAICDYADLEFLILSGNPLQSTIPTCLADVPSLRAVEVASCSLTGSIPATMSRLSDLSILDMSSNLLTGTIPLELGDLTNLQYLELQKNSLTGAIPSEMGNALNLKTLNVNKNYLKGTFPPQLDSLVELESLHIQGNSGIRGEIPAGLCDVSTLEVLAENIGCSIICDCCSDSEATCGL